MLNNELSAQLIGYLSRVAELETPADILEELHCITTKQHLVCVLGAGRFPLKFGDWSSIKIGKTVFVHKQVPEGWWEEYITLAQQGYDPGLMMARMSLAPFTWTESLRLLEPIGIDRWPYDLALKYGMRDGLTCPVGARWVVAFWSRKELSKVLIPPFRALLFTAASFAAMRLEKLTGSDANRIGSRSRLTPRELAALRWVSLGKQINEVARLLELGEETVRSHLKKAQRKLGVHNRTHAVAEAMRQHLIP